MTHMRSVFLKFQVDDIVTIGRMWYSSSLEVVPLVKLKLCNRWTATPHSPFPQPLATNISSVQFISVTQSYLTLCNPMNHRASGLPVHYQLPEFTQTNVHWVDDAIQPSHPLSSPSPPALNLSQHQDLFKWVSSLHQGAKVLELQL